VITAPETIIPQRERQRNIPTAEKAINDTLSVLGEAKLPVFEARNDITELIASNKRLIIEAETGSGKSTVMPVLALRELEQRKPGGRVVVTQPRRVAAESLYSFLKKTMGEKVGFKHGGRSHITPHTQLEFTIEQSLLNEIVKVDPLLLKYDTVILDEIHEREVNLDILMPLLKQAQSKRQEIGRPLKLILTSATMDKDKMLRYFDGASHREVEGKMYDVKEYFEDLPIDPQDVMTKAAEKASELHLSDETGDILIFMPGKYEIEKTIEELKKHRRLLEDDVQFVPLLGGDESAEAMDQIHKPSSKRRIFVATNVAETSITIPSVDKVIDSGLMRVNIFNPETEISGLETRKHTKSNARQRKGRAGRTRPGSIHYLFTQRELSEREDFLPPAILRTDLAAQVLLMKKLGIENIENFDFLDHPGREKINKALTTLTKLGALKEDGSLSEIGHKMTEINAEPRFARMIIEAEKRGCVDAVALIAGVLQQSKPIFDTNFRKYTPFKEKYRKFVVPGSDIATIINIWNDYVKINRDKEARKAWQEQNGIKTFRLYSAANARREMLRSKRIKDQEIELTPEKLKDITECVITGLLDNVVVKNGSSYQTQQGASGVQIDKNSAVYDVMPEMFVAGSIRRFGRNNTPFASFNIPLAHEQLEELTKPLRHKDESKDKEDTTEVIRPENTRSDEQVSVEDVEISENEEVNNVTENHQSQGDEEVVHAEDNTAASEVISEDTTSMKKENIFRKAKKKLSLLIKRITHKFMTKRVKDEDYNPKGSVREG
jgi:HrpA-like RNA helicase